MHKDTYGWFILKLKAEAGAHLIIVCEALGSIPAMEEEANGVNNAFRAIAKCLGIATGCLPSMQHYTSAHFLLQRPYPFCRGGKQGSARQEGGLVSQLEYIGMQQPHQSAQGG